MASTTTSTCEGFPLFSILKEDISKLLQEVPFFTLRRALLHQVNTPRGVQFPDDLHQSIKVADKLDALLNLLTESGYLSPVDLRLLDVLVISPEIKEAQLLLEKYKDAVFPKKVGEILSDFPLYQQRVHGTIKVASRLQKEPNEVTVGELPYYCNCLERNIMDINSGSCVLKHLDTKCHEVHWLIPIHFKFHAFNSALRNRHKFCDIHLQYLQIESYPPIYDPFTIQPAVLSTLLHLPRPIASTPAEAINHYYCFLADNLDNNAICQTMLKLEIITEECLVNSAKMCSDYQRNVFLLDQLLITDTFKIVEFCYALQSTDSEQEIGVMLVNTVKSISTDGVESITDRESSVTPAISEENNANICSIYQPETFLSAKTVHIRFVCLVAKLKQELNGCGSQKFLDTLSVLSAGVEIAGHLALLPSDYLEDLSSANIEEIFDRVAFLWSWNNHSVLRAVVEANNCHKGIKILEEFESQIDATQPMELFPIPPPSMKMAPSSSSAFTVLSIRVEYDKDEPVPLQFVNDVATIMKEKFEISSHALLLLAARPIPLMFYWMIPKSIVSLISTGVNKHSDYLKENRFLEIAIYPNTILFATDNSGHGLFDLLSIHPQVYKQSTTLKNEVSRLKTHKKQLSSELGELKGKYQSLSQEKSTFINESETIMCQLEEMLIETKSSFTKLPFLTKHKGNKEKETITPLGQGNDMASDITKRPSALLNRLQSFKAEFEELKDVCTVNNLKSDLSSVHVRVKKLEYALGESQSELTVKSTEINQLMIENKSLINKNVNLKVENRSLSYKNIQLEKKLSLNDDNSAMVSQSTMFDLREQESTQSDVSSLNSPGKELGQDALRWIAAGKAKVRYGRVLLSGSCDTGKASFFCLLMNQSKNVGLADDHTVILTTKVSIQQSTCSGDAEFQMLDFNSEISQLKSCVCAKVNDVSSLPTEQVRKPTEKIWDILTFMDAGGTPDHIRMLLSVNNSVMATFVVNKMKGGVSNLGNQVTLKCGGVSHSVGYSNLDLIKALISFTDNIFLHKKSYLDEVCCEKGSFVSYLSFIGTHSDEISEKEVEKFDEVLARTVGNSESKNVLASVNRDKYQYLIPVDNTTAGQANEDRNASEIRNTLYKLLQKRPTYEVPYVWLLLELEIRKACKDRKCKCITFDEVLKLCKQKSYLNNAEDFIREGLKFNHSFGVLLYFDKVEGMKDLIITDHKWLCDKLTNIILCYHKCKVLCSENLYDLKQGIFPTTLLESDMINLAAETFGNIDAFHVKQSFLELLQYLKIIAPIENSKYFMPCLLNNCAKNEQKILDETYGTNCIKTKCNPDLQVEPLLIQFTPCASSNQSGSFPRGVFCCLIVQLLQDFKEEWRLQWSPTEEKVYSNLVTFCMEHEKCGHYITMIDRQFFLEVQIRHSCTLSYGYIIYCHIFSVIMNTLHQVGNSLNFCEFNLIYGFPCHECGKSEMHMTRLLNKDDKHLHCFSNRPTDMTLSHKIWLNGYTSNSDFGICGRKRCFDANAGKDEKSEALDFTAVSTHTRAILTEKPEMWDLISIVRPKVRAHWKILAYSMGYKAHDVQGFERDGKDSNEQCYKLFENWTITGQGCTPKTWEKLLQCINAIDELNAAAKSIESELANKS